MAARDICEPQIIRALEKEGWRVLKEQYTVRWRPRYPQAVADLLLERHTAGDTQRIIVVEVKCFGNPRIFLSEFYTAVGQCLFYRNVLTVIGESKPVYLAIPDSVYNDTFQVQSIQATLTDAKIKMVVVDMKREEVAQWIEL